MSALSNLLIPAVLFFALGFIARVVKTDLRLPPDMAKMLSIYLLVAIGLHGGYELGKADLGTAVNSIFWAMILGFLLPVMGYGLLILTRRVDPMNAAAIAAHYGSVSAGTFLTAIAYLDNLGIDYESYPWPSWSHRRSSLVCYSLPILVKKIRLLRELKTEILITTMKTTSNLPSCFMRHLPMAQSFCLLDP